MEYRIKELREKIGLTQAELADKSGVSRAIIIGLESGKNPVTKTDTLIKLSKALGKGVDQIFLSQ